MALVLRYALQDNAASTTVMASTGSNGTLTGAGNTSASSVEGRGGLYPLAMNLDGSNDYIATASTVTLSADWSIGAWVKKDGDTGFTICGEGLPDDLDRIVWGTSSENIVSVQTGEENPAASLSLTHDTNWHHLFVTFVQSSGLYTLYVDGASVDTDTPGSAETMLINRVGATNVAFSDGRMADFRVYDEALAAGTILSIYQEGLPFRRLSLLGVK
jgi:hypothetical protein